jgi:DsbC/DsbD-like thiol-disulfide interchange protein
MRAAILGALAGTAGFADRATAQDLMGAHLVQVDVLPGWREPDGSHFAGVRIRMQPGWKTYWRTPGDGGIPPLFDLAGSDNLSGFTLRLPAPVVFEEDGLRSMGYTDEVVFPIQLQSKDAAAPIRLDGALHIGVCEKVCVPVEVRLQAELDAPGQSSALITAALAQEPALHAGTITCEFTPTEDGLRLRARIAEPVRSGEVAVIELGDPTLWVSDAETTREGGALVAQVDIYAAHDGPIPIDRSGVRMTVLSEGTAYERRGCGT